FLSWLGPKHFQCCQFVPGVLANLASAGGDPVKLVVVKYHDFVVSAGLNINLDIAETYFDSVTYRRHRIFTLDIGPAVSQTDWPARVTGQRLRKVRWQVRWCHGAWNLFSTAAFSVHRIVRLCRLTYRRCSAISCTKCLLLVPSRSVIWVRQENPSAKTSRSGEWLILSRIPSSAIFTETS